MKAIATSSLTKFYGKSRGIIDITFTVNEGDFFGFIGPNGAGKSTMIRTLLGLITPTSGKAELFGNDILHQKREILSKVGYIPSEPAFYPSMKVKDALEFSANLRKISCQNRAKNLCERLRLDWNQKIGSLSLGNRKKVSIICALQHNPKLYILDEPTSGLDPLMQREFYAILTEKNKEGATIFLSSHNLSEVQRYCSHAAVIRKGRLLLSEKMEKIAHEKAKRVTLRGLSSAPSLDNMKDVTIQGDSVRFLYSGKPDLLLKTLASLPITEITITEPDLEEIFSHYYAEEEKEHDSSET